VSGKFDKSELSFAEILLEIIIFEQISVSDNFSHSFEPFLLTFLRLEIENSRLVRWQDNLDWIELATLGLGTLRWDVLDEGADHGVHDSVGGITLLSIAIELITSQYSPMFLVSISLRFEEALSLENVLLIALVVSESFQGLRWAVIRHTRGCLAHS